MSTLSDIFRPMDFGRRRLAASQAGAVWGWSAAPASSPLVTDGLVLSSKIRDDAPMVTDRRYRTQTGAIAIVRKRALEVGRVWDPANYALVPYIVIGEPSMLTVVEFGDEAEPCGYALSGLRD